MTHELTGITGRTGAASDYIRPTLQPTTGLWFMTAPPVKFALLPFQAEACPLVF
jgi:hypothetical protein